jgi:hypothetical protein
MPSRGWELFQRGWVHRREVGDDLHRPRLGGADGVLEEAAGSPPVTLGGDKDIDDLAELVDGAVYVAPASGDLHIRLVDLPAVPDTMTAGSGGLGEQRREPLHPPEDGDVVDLDTAFGEQFFDVAEGQAERRYQRTASTITSGGKQKPAKADRGTVAGRGRQGLMTTVCLLKSRSQQMQQCRVSDWTSRPARACSWRTRKRAMVT